MHLGHRITALRLEKGLLQKELAISLRVSPATISNYEKGNHIPDPETLCKIADFFNVTTDYLLGRTNYRYNPKDLNKYVAPSYTMTDVVNTFLELSPASATKALDYVQLLIKAQENEIEEPSPD